jgi:hypothetical protein
LLYEARADAAESHRVRQATTMFSRPREQLTAFPKDRNRIDGGTFLQLL